MRVALLFFVSLIFYACSYEGGSSGEIVVDFSEDELDGMVRVVARNANALLGTNDSQAKTEEYPQMRVKIDYSFSMGQHEVTCGEFNKLMKSQGLTLSCENKDLPATDLTYYDAVLFANEMSKANKFDTVYTFTSKQVDSDGHCTFLEGFNFHPDVEGFRLPTEAEWVLVAGRNWNPAAAWNAENSNMKLHEVCSRRDSTRFCDLAGNAMEWVNDWLGFFRDTTIYNYAGSPDGGNLGRRILKGGCYRQQASAMQLYSRTDVYTVTSSTRAEYVGFRLAFGSIPDAVWMSYDGQVNSSRVIALVNQRTLKSIFGTYKAILAFRNNLNGHMGYFNFSNGSIYTVDFPDVYEDFHPEISPNGRYIAYCSGLEGVSGTSTIYVRRIELGVNGIVGLNVESAAIPRWRVLPNGDTVIVYVTDAGNNKNDGSFKSASTWQVTFQKGRFGKPKKLFDGAYHDGISPDEKLTVSGARLLRARIADSSSTVSSSARDTVWFNGEQACNASLSMDGTKKTLFLDFGSKTGRDFVGESYGVHERLLVMDSTGKLIRSVKAPAGYSFDHSEWVRGRSDYAVATLADANGMHNKIVLVNFLDSSITELAEGDDLWQPNLWLPDAYDKSTLEVDEDSAGVYMHVGDNLEGLLMRYNMEVLWKYRDTANVVVLGSSRPMLGVSPKYFSPKFFVINLAQTPNSIYMSRDYLDTYIFPHVKRLKYIILSLDLDLWYKSEEESFFVNGYEQYAGYVYDKNHDYWKDGYPNGLLECTENYISVDGESFFLDDRGRYLSSECKSWGDRADIAMDSMFFDKHPEALENSIAALKEILKKAEEREIYVIGVIFPLNPNYKKTGAFGRYGMRRSLAQKVIADLKGFEDEYPHFRLYDQNLMGDHTYDDDTASDSDHLCSKGASKISTRINEFMKQLR